MTTGVGAGVPSQPLSQLLQRDIARAKAREVLGDVLDTTEDMVNEGTRLLGRLLSEAGRVHPRRRAHTALLLLLRHVIKHADAVDELLKAGILSPAALHVRSILEAHMQMLYLLGRRAEFRASPLSAGDVDPVPRDTAGQPLTGQALEDVIERRGAAVLVGDLREQLAKTESYLSANLSAWFKKTMGAGGIPAGVAALADDSALGVEVGRLRARLAEAENVAVDAAIQAARGKRKYDPKWYAIDGGPESVRALAASVGLASEYDLFYSPASAIMHASDVRGQLGPERPTGGHGVAPLRHAGIGADVVRTLIIQVVQVYRLAYQVLRPGDEALWKEWTPRWTAVAKAIE